MRQHTQIREGRLNESLASTVRRLRTEKGLSQEQLASLAQVDRTYISGIERARRNITIATLERLIPHLTDTPVNFFGVLSQEIEQKQAPAADPYEELPLPRAVGTA